MAEHNELGKKGEKAAIDFLRSLGHEILMENYRFKRAEIDIISKDGFIIVFTEVKTRTSNKFGYPEESVGRDKMKLMKEAAEEFMYQNNHDCEVRFDIVSITVVKEELKLHHIPDAFFYEENDRGY